MSNLLAELDASEDGTAALLVPAGLPQPPRAALLSKIDQQIAAARRSRTALEVQVRYGAAIGRPQVEMVYFVLDDRV
jgi:hypothetical protein